MALASRGWCVIASDVYTTESFTCSVCAYRCSVINSSLSVKAGYQPRTQTEIHHFSEIYECMLSCIFRIDAEVDRDRARCSISACRVLLFVYIILNLHIKLRLSLSIFSQIRNSPVFIFVITLVFIYPKPTWTVWLQSPYRFEHHILLA